jgi:Fic family protein
MILCHERAMRDPLLYLSLFLKTRREEYYQLLQDVRFRGRWEDWLRFFLQGVEETAEEAVDTARRIRSCFEAGRAAIATLGRPASSALRLHEYMQRHPIFAVADATKALQLTKPTVGASVRHLQQLGIVRPVKARARGTHYVYDAYMRILSEGTEP